MKPVASLLAIVAGAVLLSTNHRADARTWAASIENALVVSGGPQTCLGYTFARSPNICSNLISVDWSGGINIDTTGVTTGNWFIDATYNGFGPSCSIYGLSRDGTTVNNSGQLTGSFHNNFTASEELRGGSVFVPLAGYAFVNCALAHGDQINSIDLDNP